MNFSEFEGEFAFNALRQIVREETKFELTLEQARILAARAAIRSLPSITSFSSENEGAIWLAGFRACYMMDATLHRPDIEWGNASFAKARKNIDDLFNRVDPKSLEAQTYHAGMVSSLSTMGCISKALELFNDSEKWTNKGNLNQYLNEIFKSAATADDHEIGADLVVSFMNDVENLKAGFLNRESNTTQPIFAVQTFDLKQIMHNHMPAIFVRQLRHSARQISSSNELSKPEWRAMLLWLERAYVGQLPRHELGPALASVKQRQWDDGMSGVIDALDPTLISSEFEEILHSLIDLVQEINHKLVIDSQRNDITEYQRDFYIALLKSNENFEILKGMLKSGHTQGSDFQARLVEFLAVAKIAGRYLLEKLDKALDKSVEEISSQGTKWAVRVFVASYLVEQTNSYDKLAKALQAGASTAEAFLKSLGVK